MVDRLAALVLADEGQEDRAEHVERRHEDDRDQRDDEEQLARRRQASQQDLVLRQKPASGKMPARLSEPIRNVAKVIGM